MFWKHYLPKRKNDWGGKVVREKKSDLQVSILDLPILKTTQKNHILGGGEKL